MELNLPLEVRDYQLKTFIKCVRQNRALVLSPTASGKSLIMYLLARYYGKGPHGGTLIIESDLGNIHQMADNLTKFGGKFFSVQEIYSGKDACPAGYDVSVSTWQSIYKFDKKWFENFRCIMVDEAHLAQAKSLVSIMEKTHTVKNKFGFTGTIHDLQTHQLVLEGLFGPIVKLVTTKELQEQKFLSDLKIKCIELGYSKEECKFVATLDYQDEADWLVRHPKRNKFIKNLALSLKGNTLLLFKFVDKHGIPLYNMLKSESKIPVYYVSGMVAGEDREQIRQIVNSQKDSIIVASMGVFSTGIDIPDLNNIILGSPVKSKVRLLQSIGRGLRRTDSKIHCTFFDISDNLKYGKKINYTLHHYKERLITYIKEGFNYKVYRVKLS